MDDQKDKSLKECIKPTKPNISEETRRAVAQFFLKTSVQRILAERQKKRELKGEENAQQ